VTKFLAQSATSVGQFFRAHAVSFDPLVLAFQARSFSAYKYQIAVRIPE
jgi:hypothetical protein